MSEEKKLNGIDVEVMQAALAEVAAQPAASRAPKNARVRWLNATKFKAFVRNHDFIVDEPTHLAGDDESPNSMEYVLGAYGACLATGFVLNATKQGIAIYNMEVVLESTQDNVFTFFGLEDTGHSGFDTINAKLYVQADADETTVREIWDQTVKTSPVGNSLTKNVTVNTEVGVIA